MPDLRIANYRLRIFSGRQRAEPDFETSGKGEEWRSAMHVRVPGFDGSASVDLGALWQRVVGEGRTRLENTVIGLETIHKFGNTMQLRHEFTAVVEIDYAG